jgi:hypothetical protein
MSFDIVIPVGPNDYEVFDKQIEYTKKNILGYHNIYIVSSKNYNVNGCTFISEDVFPFAMKDVSNILGKSSRNGWYLQQLIKMYAGLVIPDILDTYLVIDSDTFFLKPTTFIENGICLYDTRRNYHLPYFVHMNKLHTSLSRQINASGICHHMIFQTKYIKELFALVNGEFWKVIIKNVVDKEGSGASEYEIYFNFMLKYYPSNIRIRNLNWYEIGNFENHYNADYISYHWHMRNKPIRIGYSFLYNK